MEGRGTAATLAASGLDLRARGNLHVMRHTRDPRAFWWPFFLPMVVPGPGGGHRYLGPDAAFGHRLARVGIVPLADTSIRLWRYGRYAYGWEDAADRLPRHHPRVLRLGDPP